MKATPDTLSHHTEIRSVQSHIQNQASHLLPTSIREISEMCGPHFSRICVTLLTPEKRNFKDIPRSVDAFLHLG